MEASSNYPAGLIGAICIESYFLCNLPAYQNRCFDRGDVYVKARNILPIVTSLKLKNKKDSLVFLFFTLNANNLYSKQQVKVHVCSCYIAYFFVFQFYLFLKPIILSSWTTVAHWSPAGFYLYLCIFICLCTALLFLVAAAQQVSFDGTI